MIEIEAEFIAFYVVQKGGITGLISQWKLTLTLVVANTVGEIGTQTATPVSLSGLPFSTGRIWPVR